VCSAGRVAVRRRNIAHQSDCPARAHVWGKQAERSEAVGGSKYTDPTGYNAWKDGLGTAFNFALSAVSLAVCAGTAGAGCAIAFAIAAVAVNTTAAIASGDAWGQVLATSLVGMGAGLVFGQIGSGLGGAIAGNNASGAVLGGFISGGIAAAVMTPLTGGELGSNVFLGAMSGAMGAAVSAALAERAALSQADAEEQAPAEGGGKADTRRYSSQQVEQWMKRSTSLYRGYATAQDAAGAALSDMDPKSVAEDREYYTIIAKARGRYFPVRAGGSYLAGEQDSAPGSQSLVTQARSLGYDVTAYVHTHSMPNPQGWQESEFFSPAMVTVHYAVPALRGVPLKAHWRWASVLALSFIAYTSGACSEGSRSKALVDSGANVSKETRVRSLLQLIVRPELHDGQKVDLGAYVVFDSIHGVGYLEYGVDVEDGSAHIIDSSPIGFQLSSLRCRAGRRDTSALDAEELRRLFLGRKAAYATVRATFVRDSSLFDAGQICDITEMRPIPNAN